MRQLIALLLLSPVALLAQPSGAMPGKCYANCFIPNQYRTETEQVMITPPLTRTTLTAADLQSERIDLVVKESAKRYVLEPAQFDTLVEQIMIKPATTKFVIDPPVYTRTEDPVPVKPETKRLIAIPAIYETSTEDILIEPAVKTYVVEPAEYETVQQEYEKAPAYTKVEIETAKYDVHTERIEIKPPTMNWIRKKGDPNCLQSDPGDCFVWCLVEEPAEYQEVTKRVNRGCDGSGVADAGCVKMIPVPAQMGTIDVRKVVRPASVREVLTEARYQTITKKTVRTPAQLKEEILPEGEPVMQNQVMVSPAVGREVEVPAEYVTVKRLVLKKPASYREETVPAETKSVAVKKLKNPQTETTEIIPGEFITVAKRIMTRQGGFTEWREVLCAEKLTGYTIREIQSALKARGYDPGPVDNQMGDKTRDALMQFQKDNKLPTGNLDFDTLNALGIRY